jgi:hypothetical protein
MTIPHIRHVEIKDEDPPVIAMRNAKLRSSISSPRRMGSQMAAMVAIVALVAIFWTIVQVYFADGLMAARAMSIAQRVAAALFFLVLIFWFVVEAGWGGGSKDR